MGGLPVAAALGGEIAGLSTWFFLGKNRKG
jgi:hypothetical protein